MANSNSTHLSYIISFLSLFTLIITVNANVDVGDGSLSLCNVNLDTFLPSPYSNLSRLICLPVWNSFVLRFIQSSDNVTTIVLSGLYTTGWVGIGFSKDGRMVGSSAVVGWINDKTASINQYFLQGSSATEVIPKKGELEFTNVPHVVVLHGAAIYLAFQLKFPTRLNHQHIILASGSATPMKNYLSTIMVEFSAGSVSNASGDIGKLKRIHGVLGIIGLGTLLPCGAIIARYFKHHNPQWYYLHASIQFVGFLVVIGTVAGGRLLYNKLESQYAIHRSNGFFLLVLSILQVMAYILRPHNDSKIRKYWNWYHNWVGRLALFLGALNIVLGIQIGGAGSVWKIGYGFLLAIVLVLVIVLEILLRMRMRGSGKAEEAPMHSIH